MHIYMNIISFFLNLKSTFKRYLKKIVKISNNLKKKNKNVSRSPTSSWKSKIYRKIWY